MCLTLTKVNSVVRHCNSLWIVFSSCALHKRQEITAKVHTDCWLPAVVFILSTRNTEDKKGANI